MLFREISRIYSVSNNKLHLLQVERVELRKVLCYFVNFEIINETLINKDLQIIMRLREKIA